MLPTCVMVSTVWSIHFRIVSTALLVFGILSDQMSYQAAAIDMRQVSIPANWCEKATTPNNTGSNGSNMLIWAPLQQKKAGSEPDSAVVILFYFVLFWRNTFYFIKLESLWEAASIGQNELVFLHIHVGFIIQPWKWLLLLCGTNHRL